MSIRDLWDLLAPTGPERVTNWGEAASDAVDGNSVGRFTAGRWYHSPGPRSNLNMVVDRAYASPFIVSYTGSFDRMVLHVTTAAESGAVARLGVYADSGGGLPGALVFDAGSVAIDSTGSKEVTINETLSPGLYWVVTVAQDSGTSPTVNGTLGQRQMVARIASAGTSDAAGYRDNSSSITGAMPATFPTASLDAQSPMPRTQMRAS